MKNDCTGTRPYWLEEEELLSFSPLSEDQTVDVCIIGGGIAGLTCAYLLKDSKKVLILEKGDIAGGQTHRTTGHLASALDDRYERLKSIFDEDGAAIASNSHRKAVEFIERVIKEEGFQCDFERLNAYLFLGPKDSKDLLEREYHAAREAGESVKLLENSPLASFDTGPCIEFQNQAQFHPVKYIDQLANALVKKGVKIFTGTKAVSFETGEIQTIHTENGLKIKADSLIVATNSPINNLLEMHVKQAAYRTYVIAAKCPKGYIAKGLYYDTADPYHYIRIVDIGEKEDLAIIGGEDHRTGQKRHPEKCFEVLEAWSRERFPKLGKIEYKWSGQIMEPMDSLGFMGRSPGENNVFMITGDSGNGLTHATIGGIIIADQIEGRVNPWEEVYHPSRKNMVSDFLSENVNTLIQYSDWIYDQNSTEIDQIKPNSGAVISRGFKKYAVYKDPKGAVKVLSAVCPHLGGVVRWNSVEKSWDCPCHGSRFDCKGKVLDGPAKKNLTIEKENVFPNSTAQ